MGLSVRTLCAALVLVAGFTTQNVTIVYLLEAKVVSGFGVLCHSALSFILIFAASALAFALSTSDWSVFRPSDVRSECSLLSLFWRKSWRLTHAQLLAAVGVANALNGFGIVYASNSQRTPPLIQTVLQNGNILASVPFSKLLLGDRKRYGAREPLLAAGLLLASVIVSVSPSLAHQKKAGSSAAAWVFVYMFGIIQGALYNTIQQLYLLRQGLLRPGCSGREEAKGILRALLFSNLAQGASYVLLFWVDALPWFGYSSSISQVADRTAASLACSLFGLGGAKCSPRTPAFAWAFVLAYACSYLAAAQLNKESSTFNMLCLVVVTASTAVVFEIPGANPNPDGTPLWSVIIALLLSLTGSVLWKRWEQKTPAAEQFAAHEEGDTLRQALLLLDEDEDEDAYGVEGGVEAAPAESEAALR